MKTCINCNKKYHWFHDEDDCGRRIEIRKKQENCEHEFYEEIREREDYGTVNEHEKWKECKKCGYKDIIFSETW